MGDEGVIEHSLALDDALFAATIMYSCRRQALRCAVVAVIVVSREEVLAEGTGILDAPEASGKTGAILHRLEMRFLYGAPYQLVVRHVRRGIGLRSPEVL